LLGELAEVVKDTTMCGLGQTASNPVLSTLRYFKGEYVEHIEKKQQHSIDTAECIKCGACRSVCKFEAVDV